MIEVKGESISQFIVSASGDELASLRKAAKSLDMSVSDFIQDIIVLQSEKIADKVKD